MSPDSLMDTLTRAEAAFGMSSHHEGACPSEEADDADGEFAPPELVALEAQLAALQVRRLELQETRRLELEASQTKMERLTSLKRQLAVLRESAREGESSGLERLRAIQNLETGWVAESGNGGDAGVDLALRESTEVEEECEVFDQRQQLGVYVMTGSEQRVVAAEAPEEQVSASAAIMTKYRDALMVQEDELSQLRNQLNELREARNALDEKKELLARVMDAREALDNNVNVPSSQRAAEVMKMFELLAEAQVGSTSGDHGDYDDCLAAPEKGGEDEGLDALEKRLDSMRTNQEALKSSNEHSGTSKSTGAAAQRESSTYPPLRSVQFDSTVHEMQSVRYDNEDEKDVLDLTVDQLMSKLAENSVPRDKESSGLSARQYTSKSALDFSSVVSAFEEQTGQSLSEHERAFLAESLAQQDSDLNDRIKRIWDGDLDAYEDVEVETFYNEGGCGAEDCGSGACTSNQCTESPIKKTPKRSGVYGCENLTDSAEVSPGRDAARLAQSLGFESVDEEQIREASSKIEEGIAQIVEHIEDLKKTQVDFRNSGHVKAYADLFSSLSGQLEQFLEARTTITQFKEVLQKQQNGQHFLRSCRSC
ncbi:hypothetical protein BC830DRAFT_786302 [Chytriomyces sp. MP71]|nr:hypothetical protein BC830DRAFT_786302 [Chytriomyces sp. MP71]